MSVNRQPATLWVYPTGGRAKKFHLPAVDGGARTGVVWLACRGFITTAIAVLEPPEHLELCDDCVLSGMEQPSVYRFFDAADRLLYVGCTSNIIRRFMQHSSPLSPSLAWWPVQRRHVIETFGSMPEAFAAEDRIIDTELPLFAKSRRLAIRQLQEAVA
ncbi:GIY-YIG nuclease family protein [Paractinoplanes maris]|uniref:GIY-YIG nuclease family protein n=1 Tax=Paractinoplanes maris TaxID=1734446 RepID=UPI002020C6EB|nr:GIY-YIG nuclease family protein [Actinoplanes maris]